MATSTSNHVRLTLSYRRSQLDIQNLGKVVKFGCIAIVGVVVLLSVRILSDLPIDSAGESIHASSNLPEYEHPNPIHLEIAQVDEVESNTLPQTLYDHPVPLSQITHLIESGDTLADILQTVGIQERDRRLVFTCGNDCESLNRLRTGASLAFQLNQEGGLERLTQYHRYGSYKQFDFIDDGIELSISEVERVSVPTYRRVTIHQGESPIRAANRVGGLSESTVFRATRILEYDIDFWRNIRPGDWFEIYFIQEFAGDEFVRDGDILALRFENRGDLFQAYLHSDGMHYEEDGAAKQRQFLKAPLLYKRISSNFSSARKHPVYGYTRAHRGVDYAAPTGTPVRSTSHGTIEKVVRNDPQAGNYLTISHANSFKTRYFHLNSFAKGIKVGKPVQRGTTIGYVGTTGVSTGPHLHYEVIENGKHRDPLKIQNPNQGGLEGIQLSQFLDQVRLTNEKMAELRHDQVHIDQVASSQ